MQRLAAISLGVILTGCTESPREEPLGPVRAPMDDGVIALARGNDQAADHGSLPRATSTSRRETAG